MEFPCSKCEKIWKDRYGYARVCENCDEVEKYEMYKEKKREKERKNIALKKSKYKTINQNQTGGIIVETI